MLPIRHHYKLLGATAASGCREADGIIGMKVPARGRILASWTDRQ